MILFLTYYIATLNQKKKKKKGIAMLQILPMLKKVDQIDRLN